MVVNGCSAYGLSLFGLPASLPRDPRLLDRREGQPLDLAEANSSWTREYEGAGDEFHFGGREWTDEENVGYFWSEKRLCSRRSSGEVVGEWENLRAMLSDELSAAERAFTRANPSRWWHWGRRLCLTQRWTPTVE
jgi:hypothetical protein